MQGYLITIIALLHIGISSSQTVIKKINKADGLSHNSVRTIFQDSKGYLWFGTLNGITRYDGNNIRSYKMNSDAKSISTRKIYNLAEDQNGMIWAISYERNAHLINPENNNTLNIKESFNNKISARTSFNQIITNGENNIYLCSNSSLYQFKPDSSLVGFQLLEINTKNILPNSHINFKHKDEHDNLWIGTQNGILILPPEGYTPSNQKHKILFKGKKKNITAILELDNVIWLADSKGNVYSVDKEAYTIRQLTYFNEYTTGAIYSICKNQQEDILIYTAKELLSLHLSDNKIQRYSHKRNPSLNGAFQYMRSDNDDNFWIVTSNRGITKFSSKDQKITYYDLDVEKRTILGEPDKQLFLEDKLGNIWLGIHGGGLNRYNKEKDRFEEFRTNNDPISYSSEKIILSLFEDKSQTLWVGQDYGGVTSISVRFNPFNMIQPFPNASSVFQNEVRAIEKDNAGNLYIGTVSGKIKVVSHNGDLVSMIPDDYNINRNHPLNKINIYSLQLDSKGNLWIATKGQGVYVIKDMTSKIKSNTKGKLQIASFEGNRYDTTKISSNQVYDILEDNYGRYWITTYTRGTNLIEHPFNTPKISRIKWDEKIINTHEFGAARCIMQDHDNNIWIGSSGGISIIKNQDLLSPEEKFISYSKYNSLLHSEVFQIFQASDKKVYLATMGNGLVEVQNTTDISNLTFKEIGPKEGLKTDVVFSIVEDYSSNLWLGTDLGLIKYDRSNHLFENINSKQLNSSSQFSENSSIRTIDGRLVFGNKAGYIIFNPLELIKDTSQYPVVLSNLYINGEKITPNSDGPLVKNLECINHLSLDHTQSSLRLEFSVLDYNSSANIKYSYKLEGYDETWSNETTNNYAVYSKLPPGKYTFKLKGCNSDGIKNKHTVSLPIDINPPFWRSRIGIIILLLGTTIVLLTIFILLIRQVRLRSLVKITDEVNEKKIIYYTNISHEFKTPLSLIIGPLEDIINNNKQLPSNVSHKLQYVLKNSRYLLHLVEDILDFRKIRENKTNLRVANGDIISFFNEIYLIFKSAADRKGVKLNFKHNKESYFGYFDPKYFEKIAYNLLANAIRHTPIGKEINLSIDAINDNQLRVIIENYGKGIDPEVIPTLFERFVRNSDSSGLGLFFVKELVNQHKGHITFENIPNEKVSFIITIPLAKENYNASDIASDSATSIFNLQSPEELGYEIETTAQPEIKVRKRKYNHKILLIEDNNQLREYLTESLSPIYELTTANNGANGVKKALETKPDLIISDILMPEQDGLITTKLLKSNADTNHIPIILLTACDTNEQRLKGIENGADDYITKPFNLEHLIKRIDKLIEQRKQLKVKYEVSSDTPTQEESTSKTYEEEQKLFSDFNDIILQNISNPTFNIGILANLMGVSRSVVFRKIKNTTGHAPNEYIKKIRTKKAAKMLITTNKTVAEIAIEVGINDPNYFTKVFKTHYGASPSVYRRENSRL